MKSVADALREQRAQRTAAWSPSRRVALALALGEEGLRAFCSAQGLTHAEGARRLRRQRQQGRRPSACARVASE
jgi:hypothetical protein